MADGSFMRVHARVRAETKLGQVVAIALSTSSHFDKSSAIEMLVTTPESYPVWYTKTPLIVPSGQATHYRYCLVEGNAVSAFEVLDDAAAAPSAQQRVIEGAGGKMDVLIEDKFSVQSLESTESETTEKNLLSKLTDYARADEQIEKNAAGFVIEGLQRLFIACYHLPMSVKRQPGNPDEPFSITWGDSLIAKSSESVSNSMKTFWIGTVSVDGAKLTSEEETVLTEMLAKFCCIPIFLDPAVTKAAYHGFCKEIMWPIFHNVDQLDHIHAAWNLPDFGSTPVTGGIGGSFSGGLGVRGAAATAAAAAAVAAVSGDGHEVIWKKDEDEFYAAYESVSKTFDAKLSTLIGPNDVVWVHDYHLMLLPGLIRARGVCGSGGVKIVFFQHIPFPTSQIFRSLPKATQLLQSIVCSDIVGFHAFDHTRHFLNATKRILGVRSGTMEGGLIALQVQDRRVIVTMSHVSIEPDKLDSLLALVEVQAKAAEIRERHKGKKIIVGVDVCHRLSGVSLKLAAFDKLLTDYHNMGSGVVLLQRCLRPGARLQDEATTSVDVQKMVDSMNAKFGQKRDSSNGNVEGVGGSVVVDYEEVTGSIPLHQRLSLWLAADVFLLTSIREGLNNMPLEYIYARRGLDNAGVVIASEFSTCSSLLSGSIKINPFNALSVADALDKALNMSAKECNQRRNRDISFVSTHPSSLWTKHILSDLQQLVKFQDAKNRKKNSTAHAPLQEPVDVRHLVECYKAAAKGGLTTAGTRVFVFDYGGTLIFKEKVDVYIKQTLSAISGRKPTPRVMRALKELSDDPNNVVMVMTGLTRLKLGDTFRGLKNVTLVTSNGLVYSWGENLLSADDRAAAAAMVAGQAGAAGGQAKAAAGEKAFDDDLYNQIDEENRAWHNFDFNVDWTAVCKIAVPIMSRYVFRTNGTCLSPRYARLALFHCCKRAPSHPPPLFPSSSSPHRPCHSTRRRRRRRQNPRRRLELLWRRPRLGREAGWAAAR